MSLEDLIDELGKIDEQESLYRAENAIEFFQPYEYQRAFFSCPKGTHTRPWNKATETKKKDIARVRVIQAGNKVGKTMCCAYEVALHATGLYPKGWKGLRFERPVEIACAGYSADRTRDICQRELCGDPLAENSMGTGFLPRHTIAGKPISKAGVPSALDSVSVRHASGKGTSRIQFLAHSQAVNALMGIGFDFVWLDEEPPDDVFNQFVRSTIAKNGYLALTFTPELGLTRLLNRFIEEGDRMGAGIIRAGWIDAPHLTEERRNELRALFPKDQWGMRENGDPVYGSGRVFDSPIESIVTQAFQIPDDWRQICAIDYGIDHPFTAVWVAFSPDGKAYIHDLYLKSGGTLADHAHAINARNSGIPVAWPHDVNKRDPNSGRALSTILREDFHVNMLERHFTNPPQDGAKEGSGGNSVWYGILAMVEAFRTGKLFVFQNLREWISEYGTYHTMNGKIVKKNDDLMDATRYAFMSERFAKPVAPNNIEVIDYFDNETSASWMTM